jgi:hypothetical protein
MGFSNYETYEKYKAVINARFVDINLELIPSFNMTAFANGMRNDYPEVIRSMTLNGVITDEETVTFQSGTEDFCYIESESGRKFIGFLNKDGVWNNIEVDSYEQAAAVLNGLSNRPPLFILRQD